MKLISIIIPVYNTKATDLHDAIESIIGQTYSNFEAILIDDGSTKDCAEYLDNLCQMDKRLRCIHRKNHGVSASRNYGTLNAGGDYLVYMDADDLLTPWYLEEGVNLIENTSSDVVIGRIVNTDDRNVLAKTERGIDSFKVIESNRDREELVVNLFTKQQPSWLPSSDNSSEILNCEGCWAHLIRRKVAIENCFLENLKIGEDTVWGLQILKNEKYRICVTNSLWYLYIQNPYSVMNQYKENIAEMLTQPVYNILAMEKDLNDVEYNAFIGWVITKLKQIIYRVYLHEECHLTWGEKKKRIKKSMTKSPWINVLNSKRKVKCRNRIVLLLHKFNFMIDIFALKKVLKNKGERQKS